MELFRLTARLLMGWRLGGITQEGGSREVVMIEGIVGSGVLLMDDVMSSFCLGCARHQTTTLDDGIMPSRGGRGAEKQKRWRQNLETGCRSSGAVQ